MPSLENKVFYMPDKLWKLYQKDPETQKVLGLLLDAAMPYRQDLAESLNKPIYGGNSQDAKPEEPTTQQPTPETATTERFSSPSKLGEVLAELDFLQERLTKHKINLLGFLRNVQDGDNGPSVPESLASFSYVETTATIRILDSVPSEDFAKTFDKEMAGLYKDINWELLRLRKEKGL